MIADGIDPTLQVSGQTRIGRAWTQVQPGIRSLGQRLTPARGVVAVVVALAALLLLSMVGPKRISGPTETVQADQSDDNTPAQAPVVLMAAATPNLADEAEPELEPVEEVVQTVPPPPAQTESMESLDISSLPLLPVVVELPASEQEPSEDVMPTLGAPSLTTEESARIDELMAQAGEALARERLMYPKGASAYDHYSDVLALQPGHTGALEGLQDIVGRYRVLASQQLNGGDLVTAREYVTRGETIVQTFSLPDEERAELAKLRVAVDRVYYLDTLSNLEKWNRTLKESSALTVDNLNQAYRYYMTAIAEEIQEPRVREARKRYSEAFYKLGKRYFKDNDMDLSHELIAKGLEINPGHEDLQDLDAHWQRRKDGKETFFDRLW